MISENCILLIKEYEGFRMNAYPDPGTNGAPWTIGYGHTKDVQKGDTCTKEEATSWLYVEANEAAIQVLNAVKTPLTQNQLDALTSFVYNEGIGNFTKSTLLKLLNQGNYDGAAKEFTKWIYAAGVSLPGLIKRRQAEKALFLKE